MKNIQNENFNENKIIYQNIRKDCPYCKMKISIEEFEDHIVCHELGQNNNRNISNNINGYEMQNNNIINNNQNQREKSPQGLNIFKQKVGGIFNSIKTNINNVIEKFDKFDSDNDSDDNNRNNNLSQNNNSSSLFSNNSNNRRNPVVNFFKKITRSNSEDSGSGSGSDDGQILNIRFPRIRIRRRNSDSEINLQNVNDNINDDNLLLDDLHLLEDDNKDDYKEILKYIPTSTVKEIKKTSDNNKCVICLSDFQVGEQESTLPCLHIFHSNCIEKWIIENKTCPICKYDISLNSLLSKNTF